MLRQSSNLRHFEVALMSIRTGIVWLVILVLAVGGCKGVILLGDPASTFVITNQLDEPVNILTKYDNEFEFQSSLPLPARSLHEGTIPIHSSGITFRAVDLQGKNIFEGHYSFDDILRNPGEKIQINIHR